jgi:ABC-2 type transport system ATP-binding protein
MRKLGRKELIIHLQQRLDSLPKQLRRHRLELANGGDELVFIYDSEAGRSGISALLKDITAAGIRLKDVQTRQSSLEDIFVDLVKEGA